jgi:hypothetical protein
MGITTSGGGHSLPAADALVCGVPHDLRPGDPRGGAAPRAGGEGAGGVTGLPVYRVRGGLVIWELSGTGEDRQRRGLRLIGYAFTGLAIYLLVQSTVVLAAGYHPRHSLAGIVWTAVTAVVMFALAGRKARTGRALGTRCCAPRAG